MAILVPNILLEAADGAAPSPTPPVATMTPFQMQVFIAVASIIAALVAGSFSFLSLVISKEQKISEFRQEWIDSVRREVSELVAATHHIHYYLESHRFDMKKTAQAASTRQAVVASDLRESYEAFARAFSSLELRINRAERRPNIKALNEALLSALDEVKKSYNAQDYKTATELMVKVRGATAPILKHEWERVKRGEPVYRVSRWMATALLCLSVLAGVILIAHLGHSESKPESSVPSEPTPAPTRGVSITPTPHP